MDSSRLAETLFTSNDVTREFSIRLWNGVELRAPRSCAGTVVLRDPAAATLLLPPASERKLAEAFMSGLVDMEGDLVSLLEAIAHWSGPKPSLQLAGRIVRALIDRATSEAPSALSAILRGRKHSRERDRAAVRHHYDVSDEFYALFLDSRMVYSCAWFPTGRESLEDAQLAKLELICRKLDLQLDDRFLDVGCGWGALLAHAAKVHAADGVGLTLSHNQAAAAKKRCVGLAEIRELDYRRVGGETFDKIASIGMMEHVGRTHLDEYFTTLFHLLRPGGLVLNHAIADADRGRRSIEWVSRADGGFIQRYIFPDSDLVPIAEVIAAAERAGFEVRDLESLREHYDRTLVCWLRRLESHFKTAVELIGLDRARMYRLYLAASAVAFRIGRISVYQLLLAKRDAKGRAEGLPSSRRAWTP